MKIWSRIQSMISCVAWFVRKWFGFGWLPPISIPRSGDRETEEDPLHRADADPVTPLRGQRSDRKCSKRLNFRFSEVKGDGIVKREVLIQRDLEACCHACEKAGHDRLADIFRDAAREGAAVLTAQPQSPPPARPWAGAPQRGLTLLESKP